MPTPLANQTLSWYHKNITITPQKIKRKILIFLKKKKKNLPFYIIIIIIIINDEKLSWIWSNEDILNRENTKNLNYTNYVFHNYRILTITIQFRLHTGQLISRILYLRAGEKKKTKLLKKLYCRVLLIPSTVLPKKKKKKKKNQSYIYEISQRNLQLPNSFLKPCTSTWCFLAQSFSINFLVHKDIDNFCPLLNVINSHFLICLW